MALVPNQRCTCGFTRFRDRKLSTEVEVERWMLFDSAVPSGGFGATPFGTYFGAGLGGTWGLFTEPFRSAQLEVTCESCSRVRSQKRLGGIAVFGGFIDDGFFYVVASDVLLPATCYTLKIEGPGGTFYIPLTYAPGTPPPIYAPTPPTTAATPPPGAVLVDTMLRARLPEVSETGSYTMTVIDRCCGCETTVATATLEALPMIFSPLDADIGGAPHRWLENQRITSDVAQPAGSTRLTIPFDKCTGVLEYDARSGQLPNLEGWTRIGTGPAGDWGLVGGGALRVGTTSPNTNYWEKTLVLTTALTQVYVYTSMLSEDIPAGAFGAGLDVQGLYRSGVDPYNGVRLTFRENQIFYTRLDGVSDTQIFATELGPQWIEVSAAQKLTGEIVAGESTVLRDVSQILAPGTFGTVGAVGAIELKARFGNTIGAPTLVGYFRNVVVSGPGRFMRARFTAYSQVSGPMVRLYVVSDATASLSRKARFLVRYGPGTGNPYGPLPLSVSATVNMLVPNTIYEVPLELTGLSANQPFWFTIERDWTHGDDLLEATAHLHQVTVRSS